MAKNSEPGVPQIGGHFLSQEFVNNVKGTPKTLDIDRSHLGLIFHKEQYTMENGRRYVVTSSEINKKRQTPLSDTASLETSAWLTKNGGMNKRRQIALGRDFAIPSTFVGVQQNKTKIGSVEQNAHNLLTIHDHVAERFGRDRSQIIINGISRGAMNGLAMHSVADQHDINVLYGDYIVPCFPQKVSMQDVMAIKELLTQEASAIRTLKLPFNILRHYPQTLDGSLHGMFQQLKEVPTLLSGKVGEMVEQQLPEDAFGHITAYGGDIMSQGYRWQELFEDMPNMEIDLIPDGGHLTCVSGNCFDAWHSRMEAIQTIFTDNPVPAQMGNTALHAEFVNAMDVQAKSSMLQSNNSIHIQSA